MEAVEYYLNLNGERVYLPCPIHNSCSINDCFECKVKAGYFKNLPYHIYEQSIPIPMPPGWRRTKQYKMNFCQKHGDLEADCYYCHQEAGNLDKFPENVREFLKKDSDWIIAFYRPVEDRTLLPPFFPPGQPLISLSDNPDDKLPN